MYSEAEQYYLIQRMMQSYSIRKPLKKKLNVKLHKQTTYSGMYLAIHTRVFSTVEQRVYQFCCSLQKKVKENKTPQTPFLEA